MFLNIKLMNISQAGKCMRHIKIPGESKECVELAVIINQ